MMVDDRLTNEIEHGKYLAFSNAGEIWNWETAAGTIRWKRRVEMLTHSLTIGMKVLELGCGTGFFTREILKKQVQLTAIDISPELIAIARESCLDSNVEFIVDNAYQMSFNDNSFDAVIGSSVLHHLEVDLALDEIFRVLKPGGYMVFTEPNMMNPQIALQKNIPALKRALGDSPDESAFFIWSIKKKLKIHGFGQIGIVPFDFLHPGIPKGLIKIVKPFLDLLDKTPLIKHLAGSLFIKATKHGVEV